MLPMRGHRGQNTISKLNPARARTYCMHHDGQPALTDTDARMLALSQVRPAPPPRRPFSARKKSISPLSLSPAD